jgi:hypothetical protein
MMAWSIYWELPIVLFLTGLVQSATRTDSFAEIWNGAVDWFIHLGGIMVLAGVLLYVGALIL